MAPSSPVALKAVEASPRVHELLQRLHAQSESQEKSASQFFFYLKRLVDYYVWGQNWSAAADAHMRDKFVSLEADKCQLMYLLARSSGARWIVEAGTSFGVSTIYLGLAVGQNIADSGAAATGKVIGTEKEPSKAAKAREHFQLAGEEVQPYIEIFEGDLLETLKDESRMPQQIDMLLLDIWTPLALPTLENVKPRLGHGAIVLVDNTSWGKHLYRDLLEYLHDPRNGFKTTTIPYSGGFEMAVYLPSAAT